MTIKQSGNRVELFQGDGGDIIYIENINPDINYDVYFAISDENYNAVGPELHVQSNYSDKVPITLSANLTDLLEVPADDGYKIYYYGVKLVNGTKEDTVIPTLGQRCQLIVYKKVVEGP